MTRAGSQKYHPLGIVIVGLSATLPSMALAAGEAGAIDPGTAVGGGAAMVVAIGALAYAVRTLAGRQDAPNGPSSHPSGGIDTAQSIQLAELRAELRHVSQQVERHASLHDRTRDDIAAAVRTLDRVATQLEGVVATVGSQVGAG